MKLPLTGIPLRQKELWFEVILDFLLLGVFVADRCVWPASKSPAITIFTFSYILPMVYSTLKLHTTDETRTDERDNVIKGRGQQAGYLLTTYGIWSILIYSSTSNFPFVSILLVLLLCSRILTNSVQLRIYSGHEAWWPDALIAHRHRRQEERLKSMRERMRP
jgi:hypothetical protein